MLLQTILDIRPRLEDGCVELSPYLPDIFKRITIERLSVGSSRLCLKVEGTGSDVRIQDQRHGRLQVVAVPA